MGDPLPAHQPHPQAALVIYLERRPEVWFHQGAEAPLLVIKCSAIDFVEHGGDLADLSTRSGA
jgi:hypothetical protein